MARCPDCGGEVKYKAPFMVCLDCGLSFKRSEIEEMHKKIKSEQKLSKRVLSDKFIKF